MILRKNWLYVYTDGSSLPKPRRGGIGIRYVYLNEKEEEFRIDGYEFGLVVPLIIKWSLKQSLRDSKELGTSIFQ